MHLENRPSGFLREIDPHLGISDDTLTEDIKAKYPDRESLRLKLHGTMLYADFLSAFPPPVNGVKILDVGAGQGLTSIYLAFMGHSITIVDPSPFNCRFVKILAKMQGVYIEVLNTTGEEMGDVLRPSSFDIIYFHAALHHCDDPVEALKQAHRLLSCGGEVLLLCEPCLPAYRTKRWFNRMLLEHPGKVGHYGGNEHIYRIREYAGMLEQAGFQDVRAEIPPSLFNVMFHQGESRAMIAAKRLFSCTMKLCQKCGIIPIIKPILDRLSLGTRIFIGKKERG